MGGLKPAAATALVKLRVPAQGGAVGSAVGSRLAKSGVKATEWQRLQAVQLCWVLSLASEPSAAAGWPGQSAIFGCFLCSSMPPAGVISELFATL